MVGAREESQLGHQGGCDTLNKTEGDCLGKQVLWEGPEKDLSHLLDGRRDWGGQHSRVVWVEPSIELGGGGQSPGSLGGSVDSRRRPEEGRPCKPSWGASRMWEQLPVVKRGQVKLGLGGVSWIWQVETSLVSMREWLQQSGE